MSGQDDSNVRISSGQMNSPRKRKTGSPPTNKDLPFDRFRIRLSENLKQIPQNLKEKLETIKNEDKQNDETLLPNQPEIRQENIPQKKQSQLIEKNFDQKMDSKEKAPLKPTDSNDKEEKKIPQKDAKTKKKSISQYLDAFLSSPTFIKIISPDEFISKIYHVISFLISCYNVFNITFRCVFMFHFYNNWKTNWAYILIWFIIDVIFDIFMIFDIIVNNFHPYTGPDGLLVYDYKKTSRNYIHITREPFSIGWFYFDFLAAIPFDWIIIWFLPGYVQFFRLNRVIRVVRFNEYFAYFETYFSFSNSILRLFKFTMVFLFVIHLFSLGFWIVCLVESDEIVGEWTGYKTLKSQPIWATYLYSFYYVYVSMVGFGGNMPLTTLQVIISQSIVLVGIIMLVSVIATVGAILSNKDSNKARAQQKLNAIKNYMKYRKLDLHLQQRIIDYYNFLWKTRKGWDENQILSDLPPYLRKELSLSLNAAIIEKVEIFKAAKHNKMFISSIVMSLTPRVTLPGSKIVVKNQIGREMFFISSGTVAILNDEGEEVHYLGEGNFFGEISLVFQNTRRTATVIAKTYCDLYVLTKESFDRIAHDFPKEIAAIKRAAAFRKSIAQSTRNVLKKSDSEAKVLPPVKEFARGDKDT